jgi:hypothetical protein
MTRVRAIADRHDGWTQVAVVLSAVLGYLLARAAIEPNWAAAYANARRIAELEQLIHLGWEDDLQQFFLSSLPGAVKAMNAFYFLGHFVLTGVFFVWLYRRDRDGFRAFRDGFMAATLISAFVHWYYPAAPPRLLGDLGFVDTLSALSGIDIGSPNSSALSNPVAAVPSLHAGYALGVGAGLLRYGRSHWAYLAGVGYPVVVVLTIIVTGNHFVLDAVAGLAVMAAGFLAAGLLRGRVGAGTIGAATRGGAVR